VSPRFSEAAARLDRAAASVRRRLEGQFDDLRAKGEAGGGMVRVEIALSGRPVRIEIDPALKRAEMVVPLEDLVVAAFAQARAEAERTRSRLLAHGREEVLRAAVGIVEGSF
jgi:DNA-binding protein YbaB